MSIWIFCFTFHLHILHIWQKSTFLIYSLRYYYTCFSIINLLYRYIFLCPLWPRTNKSNHSRAKVRLSYPMASLWTHTGTTSKCQTSQSSRSEVLSQLTASRDQLSVVSLTSPEMSFYWHAPSTSSTTMSRLTTFTLSHLVLSCGPSMALSKVFSQRVFG